MSSAPVPLHPSSCDRANAVPRLSLVESEHSERESPPEPCVLEEGAPPLTHRFIGKLAAFAYEVVEGSRSVGQLGGWVSITAAHQLAEHRALNVERRSLHRDSRRIVPTVQRVRISQPAPRIVEAAVVLNTARRSRAVALRLELVRRHWQATSITVL